MSQKSKIKRIKLKKAGSLDRTGVQSKTDTKKPLAEYQGLFSLQPESFKRKKGPDNMGLLIKHEINPMNAVPLTPF